MPKRSVFFLHYIKISLILTACSLVLLTTGCIRFLPLFSTPPATIVDSELYFKNIKSLPPEVIEKLPSDLVYYSAASPMDGYASPSNFSEVVYNHLSLNFLWTGAQHSQSPAGTTYAAMPSLGQKAARDTTELCITSEFTKETFKLIAILDWDDTGTTDWLVLYKFESLMQPENSTRLLLIRDIQENKLLTATVLSVTECYGNACKEYSGDKLTKFLGYKPAL